jgi:membrane protein
MTYVTVVWHFIKQVLGEFTRKRCQQRAAALTYMTMFSLVPMMTVVYTMLSVVPEMQGASDQLQELVFKHIVPSSGSQLNSYLEDFSTQARNLTWVGVVILVVTAYLMLKDVEKAFNDIWGVEQGRNGVSNFLLYWAILSLGPLLLGVGLAMSTYLLSLQFAVVEYDSLGILPALFSYVPWVLTALAFTLLFSAVPNCKVPFRDAFIGGVISAILFELLKDLFGMVVAHSSFRVIYGAFAIVPFFLLWMNMLWMIVLAGAVLVRNLTAYRSPEVVIEHTDLMAGLMVLWCFHQHSRSGSVITDEMVLGEGVSDGQWQNLRSVLIANQVITVTQQEDYVLCRDLDYLTLAQFAQILDVMPTTESDYGDMQHLAWFPAVHTRLSAIEQHAEGAFDVSLEALFMSVPDPDANLAAES